MTTESSRKANTTQYIRRFVQNTALIYYTGGKQLDDAEQTLTVIKDRITDLGLLE